MRVRNPLLPLIVAFAILACGESRSQDASAARDNGEAETPQRTQNPVDSATASASEKPPVPSDIDYEVIGEDTFEDERRSLDVRLNGKVSEEVLEALAYRLREQASQSFERTFIVYYLPGMEVDAGGWATSHFDPELDVQILGLGEEVVSRLDKIRDRYGQNLIGIWENNQPGSAATFALFKTESGFGLEENFPDGSSRTFTVHEESSDIGRRFQDPENTFDEYWLLRQGKLELHDPEGVVFVAHPVSSDGS